MAIRSGGWPIKCECGATLQNKRSMKQHIEGALHRDEARIRILLNQPCMTLRIIGDRLGISHERVRQIAVRLGIDTSEVRRKVCVLNNQIQRQASVLIRQRDYLIKTFHLPDSFNIEADLNTDRRTKRAKRAWINGHRCAFAIASKPSSYHGNNYYHFHRPSGDDYEFLVLLIGHNRIYIMPADWTRRDSFIPVIPAHHKNSRDWEQWREAWYLV